MQMTNGIQHTLTHTVSFQADGSRIKHTDVQSVLHTEPRAALQGPSPPTPVSCLWLEPVCQPGLTR